MYKIGKIHHGGLTNFIRGCMMTIQVFTQQVGYKRNWFLLEEHMYPA